MVCHSPATRNAARTHLPAQTHAIRISESFPFIFEMSKFEIIISIRIIFLGRKKKFLIFNAKDWE